MAAVKLRLMVVGCTDICRQAQLGLEGTFGDCLVQAPCSQYNQFKQLVQDYFKVVLQFLLQIQALWMFIFPLLNPAGLLATNNC